MPLNRNDPLKVNSPDARGRHFTVTRPNESLLVNASVSWWDRSMVTNLACPRRQECHEVKNRRVSGVFSNVMLTLVNPHHVSRQAYCNYRRPQMGHSRARIGAGI